MSQHFLKGIHFSSLFRTWKSHSCQKWGDESCPSLFRNICLNGWQDFQHLCLSLVFVSLLSGELFCFASAVNPYSQPGTGFLVTYVVKHWERISNRLLWIRCLFSGPKSHYLEMTGSCGTLLHPLQTLWGGERWEHSSQPFLVARLALALHTRISTSYSNHSGLLCHPP